MLVFISLILFFVLIDSAHSTEISNPQDLEGYERYSEWLEISEMPTPNSPIKILEFRESKKNKFRAYPKYNKISLENWNYLWGSYYYNEHKRFYERDRINFQNLFAHEVGHIWDLTNPKEVFRKYRKKFIKIMKYKPIKMKHWDSRIRGHERIAVAYAHCSFWPDRLAPYTGTNNHINGYGYFPTLKQHQRVCKILINATV